MTPDEKRIAREMHFDRGVAPVDIAKALGRDRSCIGRLLAQKRAPNPIGRPRALTAAKVDRLVTLLNEMVDEAESNYEVTLPMLMRRARVKVCERVVANALHERGYQFRAMREKPVLTPGDIEERYAFAKKYKDRSVAFWHSTIQVHLDNHHFKVATTARGRKLLAKRCVRGCYRTRGKSLRPGHVKPSNKLRQYTGAKGFLIAGGVGGGKVLVWHTVEGAWGGVEAERLYADIVTPALKKQYPQKRSFMILEDNDPTGNFSNKGRAAKEANKLSVFRIPKHSPDLNVLDYAIWSEVERRMRKTERAWKKDKTETRAQFGVRLARTAQKLPKEFIDKSIADMKRRCERLYEAKGGLFEEGGRKPRAA